MSINKQGVVSMNGNPNPNLLKAIPKSHNATAYLAYQLNLSENLVANQTYTIQLWDIDVYHSAKTTDTLGVWLYWGGGSVNLTYWKGSAFNNGHSDYLTKTFTITSSQASGSGASNSWLEFYNSTGYVAGTMSMEIGSWKIEKGSVPTLWIPNENDDIYVGNSSFIENNDICKIQKQGYIQSPEFIEI